jgi:chemotaxis protein methyltransferase CheR
MPDAGKSPQLLFLYYRIEQLLGIKAPDDALVKCCDYIERKCGSTFTENPQAFDNILNTPEEIYELSKFITVNETYFFREEVHFELLKYLLPQITKEKHALKICSAATSTGCEAYSIAMLLDYYSNGGKLFDYTVDAFDVSGESIEKAKAGSFSANNIRADGAVWKSILDLYLAPENDEYIVLQSIKDKVNFFSHNVMNRLETQYDIIFFRNSLIYFSSENRFNVINNIIQSLYDNGLLILGISETSSVNHPLLAGRFASGAFYFQKTKNLQIEQDGITKLNMEGEKTKDVKRRPPVKESSSPSESSPKETELTLDIKEISGILDIEDGRPNAKKTLYALKVGETDSLSTVKIVASALYFLAVQDYIAADFVLSHLEKSSATYEFTKYLRGEYFFLLGKEEEAENYYQEASVKNKVFWPAFYRIATLASGGNRTIYEYKIKKAIESIDMGKEEKYECFIGGFSPDYFRRILEKKLA